jgi:hypothetical protein
MDINPKELNDGEFKFLVVEKLDALLEKVDDNKASVDKRLDSHSTQLKAIWSGGVLSGFFAAWVSSGHK